ncbi:LOW QUALITY PROTEIN: phenoloxidase 1-like [Colletes gigas]|uniref:LOW QUALITY PROTEIN: phenoloxidase 1-like n=1 Tax=Colletes gigas TaxID=935657 RepID=UPI001C9B35F0|nr:LOW QUALITY PROTEIN: phenoloxidase 1-like [Colletes gigas]
MSENDLKVQMFATNSVLQENATAEKLRYDIQDLERWRDRIYASIRRSVIVTPNGKTKPLTEKDGIDILENIVEASSLSPNSNVYGDLHNLGHTAISYCHDPDARYLEWAGVMGDSATAMRDPIFYRWHAFVDENNTLISQQFCFRANYSTIHQALRLQEDIALEVNKSCGSSLARPPKGLRHCLAQWTLAQTTSYQPT